MEQLKSSYHDLHRIFEQSITIRDIAEPLASFDESLSAAKVRDFMDKHDFDVVGVRMEGAIQGYAEKDDLNSETLGGNLRPFSEEQILDENDPLLLALDTLKDRRWAVVRFLGRPSGIITRGDLQKAPMRMWLFGVISLFEMQMQRWIKEIYREGEWRKHLNPKRLSEVEKLFKDREARNEAIDLEDCLQLADKKMLFSASEKLLGLVRASSKRKWEKFMRDVENIRNNLAHANTLASGSWPKIAETVIEIERILKNLEGETSA